MLTGGSRALDQVSGTKFQARLSQICLIPGSTLQDSPDIGIPGIRTGIHTEDLFL